MSTSEKPKVADAVSETAGKEKMIVKTVTPMKKIDKKVDVEKSTMTLLVKNLVSLATACAEAPVGLSQQTAFLQQTTGDRSSTFDPDSGIGPENTLGSRSLFDTSGKVWEEKYRILYDNLPVYYSSNEIDYYKLIEDAAGEKVDESGDKASNDNNDGDKHDVIEEIVMPKLDSGMRRGKVQWMVPSEDGIVKVTDVICIVSSATNRSTNLALDLSNRYDLKVLHFNFFY